MLPVSLPPDLKIGYGSVKVQIDVCIITIPLSVAFVAKGELFLLTGSMQMARWKVGEAHFSVSAVDRKSYSLHPPLIVGTEVYIANAFGPKVDKWSLEANRFV